MNLIIAMAMFVVAGITAGVALWLTYHGADGWNIAFSGGRVTGGAER